MKLILQKTTRPGHASRRAFTLPDYMTAVALTGMASAGMLSLFLFCGRMLATTQTQLVTATESRQLMGRLTHDVRVAARVEVGTGDESSFKPIPAGQLQQGNALQIYLSMNTNTFLRYFVDPRDRSLRRVQSNGSDATLLASWVAQPNVFTLEDSRGQIATEADFINTVGIRVESERGVFYQPQATSTQQKHRWTHTQRFETRVTPRTALGFQAGTAKGI